MKKNTLENVIRLNSIALDALAEIGQLPADGLTIGWAQAIGQSTDVSIKRLGRQVEWLNSLQQAHSTVLD